MNNNRPWKYKPSMRRFCVYIETSSKHGAGMTDIIAQHIKDRDDARLIAGAPALLDALCVVVEMLDEAYDEDAAAAYGVDAAIANARAAIAKAESPLRDNSP